MMQTNVDRRTVVRRAAIGGGALAMAGPLQAYAARTAQGAPPRGTAGYGPLVSQGEIALPRGFSYRVVSRTGRPMSDGNPTPTAFDGQAAFRGRGGETVLVRNHENRNSAARPDPDEIPVVVPPELRYDQAPSYIGGCTRLVLDRRFRPVRELAALGGTSTNCAGGPTPWGSWITCEEVFDSGQQRHGYNFEIDASAEGPVRPEPIRAAGRFVHEAVAWTDGALYQTEDRGDASLYRYVPDQRIRRAGDLARSSGSLQALRILDGPQDTRVGFPVGRTYRVDWVPVPNADPDGNDAPLSTRSQAQARGAAIFSRQEGAWAGREGASERVYFDCTDGGAARQGQVWELDPRRSTLRLVYESGGEAALDNPDNLCLQPATGDVLLCEDGDAEQYVRGLSTDGELYDLVRSEANDTEFCGACFDPSGEVLLLNQQGNDTVVPGVTYAITGPWRERGRGGGAGRGEGRGRNAPKGPGHTPGRPRG